ncbi:hypothetical protein N9H63_01785 [bacterium]|jgi:hypothetical protein|nr:hypothetical protein [bacterium]
MIVNKYRFADRGVERQLQIPIESMWDVVGRDDAIDAYEEEVVELVINPTEDFEVTRFDHKMYGLTASSINYEFYFLPNNIDVTGATSNQWVNSYTGAGFNNGEIHYYANSFKNSFFKLDFYDTKDIQKQQIYFTVVIPTYQGDTISVDIGTPTVPNVVDIRIPNYTLDYIGDKEGFFVYWLSDKTYINLDEFYMSVKFFNGKTGDFTRMMTQPQSNFNNRFNFNKADNFFTQIRLDYTNYEYEMYDLNGVRIGTQANPIKFYEYVNP